MDYDYYDLTCWSENELIELALKLQNELKELQNKSKELGEKRK